MVEKLNPAGLAALLRPAGEPGSRPRRLAVVPALFSQVETQPATLASSSTTSMSASFAPRKPAGNTARRCSSQRRDAFCNRSALLIRTILLQRMMDWA
ncbi:hypothetical protein ACGFX8_37260 [Streptomyces sp. NPDC048362]|uniref:hypothetical protein n=1 Tax=Streptomyces sp. NPDC048362 TaxID=3365539 RepID=UPI003718A424